MIPSFLIFLREGIEGSMIISMMCTFLATAGRRDLFRWVFVGVGSAIVGSCLFGVVLYAVAKDSFIHSTAQTWFETCVFLLAVVTLTYMTFWMKSHSRSMSSELKARMGAAIAGGSAFSLATLAFVTVGRESVETVIFLLAIAFKTPALSLVSGAVLGLAVSIAISVAIYRLGVRVNMKRFFTVVGIALMVVAAGLLADAIQNLQGLGVLPGGSQTLWNTSTVLSDNSNLGDILHGLFGYASSPSLLQVSAWALFLFIGLRAFLSASRPTHPKAQAGTPGTTANA
ncbi:MAG: High-affinity Fe2+/Pb2+ permease [Chloroflexi bacterium]|jgi:high-affinity iron transporter|nr:High-affinity Fe2+/Pb2+ permease [Chloroflexota bacterium]MDB5075634.1 High-affinity Fe2+/Pb2+ permease [Chloroflexota bacterium]